MTEFDLNALPLNELKQLGKDVAKAIASYKDRRKAEARAEVDELAKRLGFSLNELVEVTPSRKRIASAPKYRHPENPAITWSGRGRKPAWMADALAAGKTLDDLAV